MAINYEYERHIQAARDAGNTKGETFLQAQMDEFNAARDSGVVTELPLETGQSVERPILGLTVLEPALSIESVDGKFVLSVSFDPEGFRKPPTCQNCGKDYSTLSKFTRINSNGDSVKLEIADTHGGYGAGEVILLSKQELEEKDGEIDDPMFPFTNPDVFQMVFGDEDPKVVYKRVQRYLSARYIHPWGGERNCEQYARHAPPTISYFLRPIFETMHESGFSLRRISEAFYPEGVDFHTTIRRRLGEKQHNNQEAHVLPLNPRKAKFDWKGIQLSPDKRVVSILEIRT